MNKHEAGLSCLAEALRYVTELDLFVFPADVKNKKSYKSAQYSGGVPWGATKDPEQIKRDFEKWPMAGVAIPTGATNEIFIVEADTLAGHAVDGVASLNELQDRYGPLPETRTARSPSGSMHYYFKYPEGVNIKNSAGSEKSGIAPGVDVRGDGGMVIAPPSVKPGKGVYEWVSEAEIADAPEWLLDLVIEKEVERTVGAEPRAETAMIAAAARVIPNEDLDWESWAKVGMAIFNATGGSEEGFGVFDEWSKKSAKYNADETRKKWKEIIKSPPDQIGAGTIFFMADAASPGWRSEAPRFSDEALALQFSSQHANDLRYVAVWNKWYVYDGKVWKVDETRKPYSLARDLCRRVSLESKKPPERKAIASLKTRAAVVALAGEDLRQAATIDQWDADPWALNTPGGVIDLSTGERRDHSASDYMTKITSVAPDAQCETPLWSAFLNKVTKGDEELQKFLAKIAGYSLTGSIKEHALFFLHGTGGNGKGVFMNTLIGIMGDYHRAAPIETFTESNTDKHPTELAMLRGARMVTSTETEEGRRWAESRIKSITGGDVVSARFMRQDFFEYRPQFKLVISGNHRPGLRSVDEAIRRRLHLIPFVVTIPPEERDKDLPIKLEAEYPGILHWMIQGCLDWQKTGLVRPKTVEEATDNYLESEDTLDQWIDECCEKKEKTQSSDLYGDWEAWKKRRGEHPGSMKRFSQRLEAKGYKRYKDGDGRRGFEGLKLKNEM